MPTDRVITSDVGDFGNERQLRIYERLKRLVSIDLAEYFRDACRLLSSSQSRYRTTTHLVSHLLREMESGFLDVLVHASGEIIDSQTKAVGSDQETQGTDTRQMQRRKRMIALKFLQIDQSDSIAQFWQSLDFHQTAHRRNLSYRRLDDSFWQLWIDVEELLDKLLEKFEENYLAAHSAFDQLIAIEKPTNEDLKILDKSPNNRIGLAYFFDHANENWLRLSKFKKHFFKYPPELTEGYYSDWAESRYLARWVQTKPVEVLKVALEIPDTDNPTVFEDICRITFELPLEMGLKLVPRILSHLRLVNHLYASSVLNLLEKFLSNGYTDEALKVLTILIDVFPRDPQSEEVPSLMRNEISSRFNEHEYETVIETVCPMFVNAKCIELINLLSSLLDKTLNISHPINGNVEDRSYWRGHIPSPRYEERQSFADLLVTALYRAAIGYIKVGFKIDEIVRRLENSTREIQQRIALQLFAETEYDASPQTVTPFLINHANFSGWTTEYFAALQRYFDKLTLEDQGKIFQWIDELPIEHPHVSPEDIRYDQAQALSYISEFLSGTWRTRYEELKTEFSEVGIKPISPLPPATAFFVGPTSPLSLEDLRTISIDGLVDYLRHWKPLGEFMSPSPEGLGRTIISIVHENPSSYAEEATKFIGLQPTYVRSFIVGFQSAARDGKLFDWLPLVELCSWVIQQPLEFINRASLRDDSDTSWTWARGAIANLLEVGFMKDAVPFEYRDRFWSVLKVLVNDADPLPDTDQKYLESERSTAYEGSLNTVRGKAFHALIQYALWCKRNLKLSLESVGESKSFTLMPEVKIVLDSHLINDTSPIIRSVYGHYFPWLYFLDEEWGVANVGYVFPTDPHDYHMFTASWVAYVGMGQLFTDLYPVLQAQYLYAVEQLQTDKIATVIPVRDPEYRLSEHLMILYWEGAIELTDEILTEFYARASDSVRSNAMRYIGLNIYQLKHEHTTRLANLWAMRLEQARKAVDAIDEYEEELAAFGWWIVAPSTMDTEWKLAQASLCLDIIPKLEPLHEVLEWLSENALVSPLLAAKCLHVLVLNAGYWDIHRILEKLRMTILAIAHADNREAKSLIKILINRLASRGDMRLKDLINTVNE